LKLKRKIGTIRKTYFQFKELRKSQTETKPLRFSIPWEWTKLSDYQRDKTANFIVNRFEEVGWVWIENKISL
jgi:hypothetical protein